MALIGIEKLYPAAATGLLLQLGRRVQASLSSDYLISQRIAGAAFGIRIASAGIVFLSQIFLARWMGTFQFGTYVYVWTWLLVLGDLAHLGLPLTAQRFIPQYTQAQSFQLLRGYLSATRKLTLALGTAAAFMGAVVVCVLSDEFDKQLFLPLYFACLALPAYVISFMTDGVARSYNWINLALVPAYLVRPLLLIGGVAVLRVTGFEINATSVLAVLAIASWVSVLSQLWQLDRRLSAAIPSGSKSYEVVHWLSSAVPMVAVWGFYTLLTSTDVLVLKYFRPAEEVAHYFGAAKLVGIAGMAYFAVAASAAHRFTAYHVTGDHKGLAAFSASTIRWVFWLTLFICVTVVVFGKPLLSLFGDDFVSAYPTLAILAVGVCARSSVGPAERLLMMLGYHRACLCAYMTAFAVNLTGCLLLAPSWGATGVALGTVGGFVIEAVLLFAIAKGGPRLHMFIWCARRQ